jgi:lysozyme
MNQKAIDLIKQFEGCKLAAYPDPATGGAPWTIGYGHTGSDVHPGLVIEESEAENMLSSDLDARQKQLATVLPQDVLDSEPKMAAILSLVFNIGIGNFKSSTLLKCIKSGDYESAAKEFLKWNKAAGKEMPGLTRRRQAEMNMFLS